MDGIFWSLGYTRPEIYHRTRTFLYLFFPFTLTNDGGNHFLSGYVLNVNEIDYEVTFTSLLYENDDLRVYTEKWNFHQEESIMNAAAVTRISSALNDFRTGKILFGSVIA